MGKHFTQKFSELLFRPEGDCAIIHVVVFSFRSFMASCILQENEARRPRFFSGGGRRSGGAKRFRPAKRQREPHHSELKSAGWTGYGSSRNQKCVNSSPIFPPLIPILWYNSAAMRVDKRTILIAGMG